MRIDEQLEMPRFTGTLRAFSNISQKQIESDPDQDKKMIKKRIQQLAQIEEYQHSLNSSIKSDVSYSWPDVVQKLTSNLKVNSSLQNLNFKKV